METPVEGQIPSVTFVYRIDWPSLPGYEAELRELQQILINNIKGQHGLLSEQLPSMLDNISKGAFSPKTITSEAGSVDGRIVFDVVVSALLLVSAYSDLEKSGRLIVKRVTQASNKIRPEIEKLLEHIFLVSSSLVFKSQPDALNRLRKHKRIRVQKPLIEFTPPLAVDSSRSVAKSLFTGIGIGIGAMLPLVCVGLAIFAYLQAFQDPNHPVENDGSPPTVSGQVELPQVELPIEITSPTPEPVIPPTPTVRVATAVPTLLPTPASPRNTATSANPVQFYTQDGIPEGSSMTITVEEGTIHTFTCGPICIEGVCLDGGPSRGSLIIMLPRSQPYLLTKLNPTKNWHGGYYAAEDQWNTLANTLVANMNQPGQCDAGPCSVVDVVVVGPNGVHNQYVEDNN